MNLMTPAQFENFYKVFRQQMKLNGFEPITRRQLQNLYPRLMKKDITDSTKAAQELAAFVLFQLMPEEPTDVSEPNMDFDTSVVLPPDAGE